MPIDSGNTGNVNVDLLLSETERKLGPAPRRLDLDERLFLLGCRWVGLRYRWAAEDLYVVYESRKRLLREGNVALGVIVQANEQLYSPGEYDLPAQVLYCSDRTVPNLLGTLGQCSKLIFALKNTEPEGAEERKFAEVITDEYRREMQLAVPKAIAGIENVKLTTFVVFRKDLPYEYLSNGFFPLLTHPNTPAVIIVPSKYWPNSLLHLWDPGS